jgi:hypothetical protein
MKQRICILGGEAVSYINRQEQLVEKDYIYYFKPDSLQTSRLYKGFEILKMDISSVASLTDLEILPAYYSLEYAVARNRQGKPEPKLVGVSLIDKISITAKDELFLMMGVKPYDYEDEKGKSIRGMKLFFLDPNGYIEDSSQKGFLPLEASIDKYNLNLFPTVPGYYDVQLDHKSGKGGQVQLKVSSFKFVQSFNDQPSAA